MLNIGHAVSGAPGGNDPFHPTQTADYVGKSGAPVRFHVVY
jgi:hypothetical protein